MINTTGMGYATTTEMISSQMYDNINQPVDMEDINFNTDEDYSKLLFSVPDSTGLQRSSGLRHVFVDHSNFCYLAMG